MDTLQSLDNLFSKQVTKLETIINSLSFSIVCNFSVTEKSINQIPFDNLNYSGLYLFEIKIKNQKTPLEEWYKNFTEQWLHEKYTHKFVSNPKKNRIKRHTELKEWMPLYIGKSKNVGKRIKEHIYIDLEKPTFAMKLLSREHLSKDNLRISTIPLLVKHYNLIVPIAESMMRDKLNPIIGRQ